MDIDFSPYDDLVQADPYPHYARLRDQAPVYRNDTDDFWALSRHADVQAAFRDTTTYSSANGILLDKRHWGPQASRFLSFMAMDPPRHTHLRVMAAAGFTTSRINALAPRIRQIIHGHWQTALDRRTLDFVADFAIPVPCDVISELLGVPPQDRHEIRRLTDLTVHRQDSTRDIPPEMVDAVLALAAYYSDLLDDRTKHPRDDYTSDLIKAATTTDVTHDELVSMLFLLSGAGNESTTHLLANAWHALHRHPDQRELAFAGATRQLAEETLRWDPPAQSIARTATHDLHLHGHTIPAGERVLLLIGAAHHDPAAFPDPDRFDLTRSTNHTLGFGYGPHFCLGAPLARLETHLAFQEIPTTITSYDIDPSHTQRIRSAHVRGFLTLPTTLRPR